MDNNGNTSSINERDVNDLANLNLVCNYAHIASLLARVNASIMSVDDNNKHEAGLKQTIGTRRM